MLITYRGRQYDSQDRTDARELAELLNISPRLSELYSLNSPQMVIDRNLWKQILTHRPGALGGVE
jgi:hypothetical protein